MIDNKFTGFIYNSENLRFVKWKRTRNIKDPMNNFFESRIKNTIHLLLFTFVL